MKLILYSTLSFIQSKFFTSTKVKTDLTNIFGPKYFVEMASLYFITQIDGQICKIVFADSKRGHTKRKRSYKRAENYKQNNFVNTEN